MQRVGVERVREPLHAHTGQTSLYLHHRKDEVDYRADVQQLVPRLVPNQLFGETKRMEGDIERDREKVCDVTESEACVLTAGGACKEEQRLVGCAELSLRGEHAQGLIFLLPLELGNPSTCMTTPATLQQQDD